jgi:hypothetical protein
LRPADTKKLHRKATLFVEKRACKRPFATPCAGFEGVLASIMYIEECLRASVPDFEGFFEHAWSAEISAQKRAVMMSSTLRSIGSQMYDNVCKLEQGLMYDYVSKRTRYVRCPAGMITGIQCVSASTASIYYSENLKCMKRGLDNLQEGLLYIQVTGSSTCNFKGTDDTFFGLFNYISTLGHDVDFLVIENVPELDNGSDDSNLKVMLQCLKFLGFDFMHTEAGGPHHAAPVRKIRLLLYGHKLSKYGPVQGASITMTMEDSSDRHVRCSNFTLRQVRRFP